MTDSELGLSVAKHALAKGFASRGLSQFSGERKWDCAL